MGLIRSLKLYDVFVKYFLDVDRNYIIYVIKLCVERPLLVIINNLSPFV